MDERELKPAAPGAAGPLPGAAVFDLDNTITRHGTYTPFLLHAAGRMPGGRLRIPGLAATILACLLGRSSRARLKERMLAAVLARATRAQVDVHVGTFVEHCIRSGLRPGAARAIDRHRSRGDHLVLATASFEFYAEPLGRRLGFDSVVGTTVIWDGDRLDGRIAGANCRGEHKVAALEQRLPGLRARCRVVAYTDHHSDIPLLEWAHTGIAVNPTRRLRAYAVEHGLEIVDWNRST
ncbi:MAG: HAD-IB family hydrolase [Gammaproteobacteria bacterium]|nr:HAD-IB family hydrolase [Gammaproteobacteria bacterium]